MARQPATRLAPAPRLSSLLHQLCDGAFSADDLLEQLEGRAAALGLLPRDDVGDNDDDAERADAAAHEVRSGRGDEGVSAAAAAAG